MGVIYKLKSEVIEYILQSKRDNLFLSCRELAQLTGEKFQFQVSKSSINAVIKNAQLSSPVGRRSIINAQSKKFEIPQDKRKQMYENTQSLISQDKILSKSEPGHSQPLPVNIAKESFYKNSVVEIKKEEPQKIPIKQRLVNAPTVKGAGLIFLKAAQWEISGKSVLGDLFRKYLNNHVPDNFDAICDALACLKILPSEMLDDIIQENHGFWKLNGFLQKPETAKLYDWAKHAENFNNLSFEYLFRLEQFFLDVLGFKVALEDGRQLIIDARMTTIWNDKVHPDFWNSSNKALIMLSNYLISNIHTPVFFAVPGKEIFSDQFFDILAVFENVTGKSTKKIVAFNREGHELASFSTIPLKKRFFIISLWPWQKEFRDLLKKDVPQKQMYYDEIMDRQFYFIELDLKIPSRDSPLMPDALRVIMLWEEQTQEPKAALLTNKFNSSSKEIIQMYLNRWPHFDHSDLKSFFKVMAEDSAPTDYAKNDFQAILNEPNKEELGIWQIFYDFGRRLENFCQKRFFTQEDFSKGKGLSQYYNLPGSIVSTEDGLYVNIKSNHTIGGNSLHKACQKINESLIIDQFGRKLTVFHENC